MEPIAKPCLHCPYKKDVKPFLHPLRAEELSNLALIRYANFICHKTIKYDDDDYERDYYQDQPENRTCAGMLTLRASEIGSQYMPKDFEPSYDEVYATVEVMQEAYTKEWRK